MRSIASELLRKLNKPVQVRVVKFHDIDGTPSTCVKLGDKYGYSQSHISNVFSRANHDYVEAFNILNSTEVKSRGTVFRDMNGELMTAEELSSKYGFPVARIRRLFKYAKYDHIEAFQLLVYQMNLEKHGDYSQKYLFKDGTPVRGNGSQGVAKKYGYHYRDVIAAFESVNWCYKKAYAVLDGEIERHTINIGMV